MVFFSAGLAVETTKPYMAKIKDWHEVPVEGGLQHLVGVVDEQLLEVVVLEALKAKDVEYADERQVVAVELPVPGVVTVDVTTPGTVVVLDTPGAVVFDPGGVAVVVRWCAMCVLFVGCLYRGC